MKRYAKAVPGKGIVASRMISSSQSSQVSVGEVIEKLINDCNWSESYAYDVFSDYPDDDQMISRDEFIDIVLGNNVAGDSYSELSETAEHCASIIFN